VNEYSHITDEMFDQELQRIMDEMSADDLLMIPGIYEVMREHLNNQILDNLTEETE
jgi:Mg/Co/Ni transporter MgtE